MSSPIEKIQIMPGVTWLAIPEANLYLLCGCPEDVVKHLIKRDLIKQVTVNGHTYDTGPNAILLSEIPVINGKFANLAEFPVLQMLYKQGMVIPSHPNNDGKKPILIGRQEQLQNQLEYIYRGNYGLISEEEMIAAGATPCQAQELMRMKLKFAFGNIHPSEDLLDRIFIETDAVEIKNGASISRTGPNKYEVKFRKFKETIDLNLAKDECYQSTYFSGFYDIQPGYFSIIHSGEGDGWDFNNPCMASILIFDGNTYLIDAGPNVLATLNALGISISSVRGVFQSHCHDDHFAGLTALIQSDHKLEYYATPLVRASIEKKLSALLGDKKGDILSRYFNIYNLNTDTWNNVGMLMVKPLISPHPVETTNFLFRAHGPEGYLTYYHMADITSLETLDSMVTKDNKLPGISAEFRDKIIDNYSIPADIKKIDIGGKPIHGEAKDFIKDKSGKLILTHIDRELTKQESEIGCQVPFGLVDTLIPSNLKPGYELAKKYLMDYFKLEEPQLIDLLNCSTRKFSAGSTLLKIGRKTKFVYLTLNGTVEMIQTRRNFTKQLATGSLIGTTCVLMDTPAIRSYLAKSYVSVLEIPKKNFLMFIQKNKLGPQTIKITRNRDFLATVPLFDGIAYSPPVNSLSLSMTRTALKKGAQYDSPQSACLLVVIKGELDVHCNDKFVQSLGQTEFCFEESITCGKRENWKVVASKNSEFAILPGKLLKEIPLILWRLSESLNKKNHDFQKAIKNSIAS